MDASARLEDLVEDGVALSGVPLSDTLRRHLGAVLARFLREPVLADRLTLRLVRAFDERASTGTIRALGDECLLACSLFEDRLRRAGGSLRHYGGLGRTAYEAAGLIEAAFGFAQMRDVLSAACRDRRPDGMRDLIDAARMGAPRSREALRDRGVLLFAPR